MNDGPSPYEGVTPVASLVEGRGATTLVEGETFALSDQSGDMAPDLPHGLFLFDTRLLSRWQLLVNGHRVESLAVEVHDPYAATFVARGHAIGGRADADLVVFRHRHIGYGMRERIAITNHGLEPTPLVVELGCDVDFADLFEVKEGRVGEGRPRGRRAGWGRAVPGPSWSTPRPIPRPGSCRSNG